jgi:hypothetical protein
VIFGQKRISPKQVFHMISTHAAPSRFRNNVCCYGLTRKGNIDTSRVVDCTLTSHDLETVTTSCILEYSHSCWESKECSTGSVQLEIWLRLAVIGATYYLTLILLGLRLISVFPIRWRCKICASVVDVKAVCDLCICLSKIARPRTDPTLRGRYP